jgi:hypothetical protein
MPPRKSLKIKEKVESFNFGKILRCQFRMLPRSTTKYSLVALLTDALNFLKIKAFWDRREEVKP